MFTSNYGISHVQQIVSWHYKKGEKLFLGYLFWPLELLWNEIFSLTLDRSVQTSSTKALLIRFCQYDLYTTSVVSKYFKLTNELIWRWAGTHLTQFLCRRCNLQFSDVPLWFAWCCYLSSDLRDQFLLAATRLDASDGSPARIQYSVVSSFYFHLANLLPLITNLFVFGLVWFWFTCLNMFLSTETS